MNSESKPSDAIAPPESVEDLHEQRDWLLDTLSSIGDAVITTDSEGRVAFLNPVAESVTGWTLQDAVGQPIDNVFAIIDEVSRQRVQNPALLSLQEGRTFKLASPCLLITKDGTEVPFDDSAAPIRNEKQEISGVVRLPIIVETPTPMPPAPTESETSSATSCRILVVDDNRDSANTLALLLRLTGNTTHTAYNGLEAVEATATFKPDVIFMDIGLPNLNGYEACRRIREQACGKKIVIVALTGWGQDADREKSANAGFNSHMVKPVDFNALKKLMAELL